MATGWKIWTSALATAGVMLFVLPATAADPKGMSSRQIEKTVAGRVIIPDEKIQQRAPPFAESFSQNHVWFGTIRSFGLISLYGTWSIKDGTLCVLPDGKKEQCREVWRDNRTEAVLIKPLLIWSRHDHLLIVKIKEIAPELQGVLNRHVPASDND